MLKVIAQTFIKPEALDIVRPLLTEMVELTLQEPLCEGYELFVDQTDPGHFVFVEAWPDRAALDTHLASEHIRRLGPLISPHARQPTILTLLDAF